MINGIVYILTNPCLDGWVKIGMTERNDINERLQELNSPANIPLSYRCYAIYEVDEPQKVEKNIHGIIDQIDKSLHARELLSNGRIREREFFKISPETAYAVFSHVAALRDDKENLKIYAPTEEQSQEEEIAESKSRRGNNSFALLGIPIGEDVSFLFDDTIVAKVLDNKNTLGYENERYTVTSLARKLLTETRNWEAYHVNGWRFFVKDGITLSDLRDRVENGQTDE
ncbi:MAG: GIY-YIG nuclease family protein [Christensenella sp.]|uniref:GIY-YIG nuclease family protein n=1 Tax=Christensenella sp. TaxID=1935934 RepID=UPI002B1F8CB5|nr:GIY-YIG nuclease family protein [Christensenella sp.]MEA5004516.1 GIY-YIG nuclease family protein [Christensenella sp.]